MCAQAVEPNHAPTCEATLRAENQIKNRYHNITACKLKCSQFSHSVIIILYISPLPPDDHSRVKLQEIPGVVGSDYINANFFDVS